MPRSELEMTMPPQNDQNKAAADQAAAEKAAAEKAAAEKVAAEKAATEKAAAEKAATEKAAKRETFGKVKVIAESKTHRVLQDDRFVWKEAK